MIDLVLGVLAALKRRDFRLAFIADFCRNDLLGKVFPAFVVYAGYVFAKSADLVIPGLDMQIAARAVLGVAMAAMVGSLLKSLRDFGFLAKSQSPAVEAIAGSDPSTPVP